MQVILSVVVMVVNILLNNGFKVYAVTAILLSNPVVRTAMDAIGGSGVLGGVSWGSRADLLVARASRNERAG